MADEPAVLISAERGWGLDELLARIDEALRRAGGAKTAAWQPDAWAGHAPSSRAGR